MNCTLIHDILNLNQMKTNSALFNFCMHLSLFFFVIQPVLSQKDSKWIYLKEDSYFSTKEITFTQSSIALDEYHDFAFRGIPDDIQQVSFSYGVFSIELLRHERLINKKIDSLSFSKFQYHPGNYSKNDHKWRIFGLRGVRNGKEVFILDSDMDLDFGEEQVHELMLPIFKTDWPKIDKMVFPSDTFYYDIEYEHLIGGEIHNRQAIMAIQIMAKYNESIDSLIIQNSFKIGYKSKLLYRGRINDTEMELFIQDRFPWENSSCRFLVRNDEMGLKTINLKDKFQINNSGNFYSIDSLDVVSKKIKWTNHYNDKPYIELFGPSLSDKEQMISLDNLKGNKNYTIVHFWGSWCNPCMRNLPVLNEFYKQNSPHIKFLGVCTDNSMNAGLNAILKLEIPWEQIYFDLKTFENENRWNISSWPTYLLLNDKNEILLKTGDLKTLKDYITGIKNQ